MKVKSKIGHFLIVIAWLVVLAPYLNWYEHPELTYMEFFLTHIWFWVTSLILISAGYLAILKDR